MSALIETPWNFTAGVETTFQPPVKTVKQLDKWCGRVFSYYDGAPRHEIVDRLADKLDGTYYNCGTDPDCIEISTRILRSWQDAEKVVTTICRAAKDEKLVSHAACSTGGGGHVHLGIGEFDRNDRLLRLALQRDLSNRPYVAWMFEHPHTVDQAMNFACRIAVTDDMHHQHANWVNDNDKHWLWRWKQVREELDSLTTQLHDKSQALTCRPTTIEYRFFDAHDDWKGYEESLAFAQAYTSWIRMKVERWDDFPLHFRSRAHMLETYNDFDQCVKDFKRLIRTLKLPWARYEHYIQNLEEKFKCEDWLT